jgi:hypothetical protein
MTGTTAVNWWGAIIAQSWFNDYFGDRQVIKAGVPYHVLSSTQQSVGSATSPIGMIVSGQGWYRKHQISL